MDYYELIAGRFQGTIEAIAMSVDQLAEPINNASELMTQTLLQDGKVITCGDGVDTVQAQLFSACLLCAMEQERPALPALHLGSDSATLTAIAAAEGSEEIYARQLRALGQAGDTLLVINSAQASASLAQAIPVARERNMAVVMLSNNADSALGALVQNGDAVVIVNTPDRSRTVELQTMVLHSFCQLIEHKLFGGYSQD